MQLPISNLASLQLNQAILPFDCHNHIQLGDWISNRPAAKVFDTDTGDDDDIDTNDPGRKPQEYINGIIDDIRIAVPECCGMALMSTHPRDFDILHSLSRSSETAEHPFQVVPSFGVHPWFVHELTEADWQPVAKSASSTGTTSFFLSKYYQEHGCPQWVHQIEMYIRNNPRAIIGEIGLDKFHYAATTTAIVTDSDGNNTITNNNSNNSNNNNNNNNNTATIQKELTTPMAQQVLVVRLQMEMAIQYRRPVCIHCVHAFGPLLDLIADIKEQYNCNNNSNNNNNSNGKSNNSKNSKNNNTFPISKVYFHAYGGKLNTVPQILSLCEGQTNQKPSDTPTTGTTKVYFGFAPCVNFRSPKTADVIREIGLSRLLLETDHEELSLVSSSLHEGIQYIATALNVDTATVIEQTTKNAMEFYDLTV